MSQSSSTSRGMKTFLIIWLGQLVSLIGSGLTGFALGVWIVDQTGKATPFAITALFGTLPRVLLAPIGGSVADRWNRRQVMILADTGSALVTLGAALLILTDQLQVGHIYLLALAGSVFGAFQEPAYTASIAMLVPKKDLTRANGLVQTGRAIEMLASPVLAGVLFVAIGLKGIILIDFVTYFFAIGALLFVHIPQPRVKTQDTGKRRGTIWRDALFGWNYLRARAGLFGLLWYFALVNFLLNASGVLTAPMVLSFGSASTLGFVQMASGLGLLIGSVLMSAWGGPQRRAMGVIGSITLAAFGVLLMGLRPSGMFVGAGLFLLLFCIPFASGSSQAVFQTKVPLDVQGRVFAIRGMISRSTLPLAYLTAGPLADYVFEPWMREGGALANTTLGTLIGTGPGRGIGLMFVVSGLTLVFASVLAFTNPRIRLVEDELPDVILDTVEGDEISPETSPAGEELAAIPS